MLRSTIFGSVLNAKTIRNFDSFSWFDIYIKKPQNHLCQLHETRCVICATPGTYEIYQWNVKNYESKDTINFCVSSPFQQQKKIATAAHLGRQYNNTEMTSGH